MARGLGMAGRDSEEGTGMTGPAGWDWEDGTGRTGPGGQDREDRTGRTGPCGRNQGGGNGGPVDGTGSVHRGQYRGEPG